jgi:hypothetical protein
MTETQGVTDFDNEAGICTVAPYEEVSTSFISTVPEYQDLKEYFARPRAIVTGVAANTRGPRWSQAITPNTLFNPSSTASWFPDGATRLQGVAGVRFTMKFTLTVAANPFHQGVMALSFQYAKGSSSFLFDRTTIASATTQLPHVRLNFAENTMVTLDVPFLYQFDYFPLDERSLLYPPIGKVVVTQLMQSPTLTTSGPATWKLFVSLHDLELIGSLPRVRNTVVPQSGLTRTARAVTNGVNTILEEAKATGAISKFANAGSKAVATLSTAVPSLAAIGGPTAWFLRTVGKVASAFGYSTPVVESEPVKHWRTDNINDLNVDVPNAANVVGPFQTNRVRVDSTMSGTDEDEMSFAYLLSKYSQIFLGNIDTTDSTGTTLYASNNVLYNYWFRTTTSKPGGNLTPPTRASATVNALQPSALMYFGSAFRQWRGGLKYRITFAKTKFHSGRLMLSFIPTPKPGSDAPPIVDNTTEIPESYSVIGGSLPQPFGYTMVIDLRDKSEFEFEVPYIGPNLYTSYFGSTGSLSLTVLDPLIANGEAATSIDYLIEVCAMPDFEFACVAPSFAIPVSNSGVLGYPTAQSGLGVGKTREACEYAIGEKVTSAKQLAMMPSYVAFDVGGDNVVKSSIPFWWYLPEWDQALPMLFQERWMTHSYGGMVAACYAFVTGSTVAHVYCDRSDRISAGIMQDYYDGSGAVEFSAPTFYNRGKNRSTRVLYHSVSGLLHAVLPQYIKTARLCLDYVFGNSNGRGFTPGQNTLTYLGLSTDPFVNAITVAYNLVVRNTNATGVRVDLGVAAGDDARAGCYIGVPPLLLFNPSQLNSPDTYLPL